MTDVHAHTNQLLARIVDDTEALDQLLRRLLPRVEQWVRQRRGALIRSVEETIDSTQDVLLQLALYLPRIRITDSSTLERLLLRMIRNSLANRSDYLLARRRALTRQQPLDPQIELGLDPTDERSPTPSAAAIANEREARLRFALALMSAEEQELLLRKHYDAEGYAAIGEWLGVGPDAARMRCKRVELRLGSILRKLEQGQCREIEAELDEH